MSADTPAELALQAAWSVTAAAVTNEWGSAGHGLARLFGRTDPRRAQAALRWLGQTREELAAATGPDLDAARGYQAQRWQGRFADLLDAEPEAEARLRALVEEIGVRSAAGNTPSSAASEWRASGSASGGGITFGVIHQNIRPPR